MLIFLCIFKRESAAFFFLQSPNGSVCRATQMLKCFGSDIGEAYWSLIRLLNRIFCFSELISFLRNDGYTLPYWYCRDPSRFASTENLNLIQLCVSTRGPRHTDLSGSGGFKNRAGTQTLCVFLWCHLYFCGSLVQTYLCFHGHNRERNPAQNTKFLTLLWFTMFGMHLLS